MLELFAQGFANAFSPEILLLTAIGVVLGIIFGSAPGISTSMGLILILPATYSMSLEASMALFLGLYVGGTSGGLISAILLNIPGTPASVPTTFDGAPMAKNGQPGKALSIGIVASFLGGLVSFMFLFFLSPAIASIAIKFSSIEYFAVSLFAIMLVASLAGKSLVKGLLSALLGMAFATVGMAPLDGARRFTFDNNAFDKGFQLVVVLIGFYAMNELLKVAQETKAQPKFKVEYRLKGFDISKQDIMENRFPFLISSLIGTGIGFLPGIGAGTASMLSYTAVKNSSKHPERFGTGISQGVVASEAANNAVIGGALIPLLTLGIPGDSSTAILLSGFMLHGITPGPLLFTTHAELVYTMFACLVVGNIVMVASEYLCLPAFLKVLNIPNEYLLPIISVLCCIGAFGVNNRTFDVITICLFTLIGYALSKFKLPSVPFLMGFILCPIVEKHLMRGLQLTQGNFLQFFSRPIAAFFLICSVLYMILTVRKQLKKL